MISPLVLVSVNRRIFGVLWEDLILGFGIATFSLCRLLARRRQEIRLVDWLVTALALVVLVNPLFFSYAGSAYAKWNNLIGGALVLLLAIYQDLHDERLVHRGA
jgi:hypothetical protein